LAFARRLTQLLNSSRDINPKLSSCPRTPYRISGRTNWSGGVVGQDERRLGVGQLADADGVARAERVLPQPVAVGAQPAQHPPQVAVAHRAGHAGILGRATHDAAPPSSAARGPGRACDTGKAGTAPVGASSTFRGVASLRRRGPRRG
jgi:hypothetical protein